MINYERNIYCPDCKGTGGAKISACKECEEGSLLFPGMIEYYMCPKCSDGKVIEEACPSCNGNRYIKEPMEVSVNIPSGVGDGNILKLNKMGNEFADVLSHVYLRVSAVTSDEYFERKGDDIYTTNYIPISFYAFGGSVKIKGLYEELELKVYKGVKDGDIIKLKGKGVRNIGDHYIKIKVVIPRIKTKINLNI
jgi:molecular chaperone DnaJ